MALVEKAVPVGGAALNFTVVGGTAQPENPKENTVWIITDVDVPGWVFADEAISGLPNHGVWIQTGSSGKRGSFNALKKNGIYVYPIGAQQWVDTGWVVRNVKIYKNGSWETARWYVYGFGEERYPLSVAYNTASPPTALTRYGGYMRLETSDRGSAMTEVKIDLSGIKTLHLTVSEFSASSSIYAGYLLVSNSRTSDPYSSSGWVARKEFKGAGQYSVDVSGVSSAYVGVGVVNAALRFTELWGE